MSEVPFTVIAHMRSDFSDKFGIPRQSGLIDSLESTVVFEPAFRNPDALRGIEGFSHLWLLWQFSDAVRETWSPTVRPPQLGGNTRVGVFATRAPYRPNAVGLSCVRLVSVERQSPEGPLLHVAGADLKDGTPIFDVKPYLAYTDSHPEASFGFADPQGGALLSVDFPSVWLDRIPVEKQAALRAVLAHDPRPRYQDDPERIYRLDFAGFTVTFSVDGGILHVKEVAPSEAAG